MSWIECDFSTIQIEFLQIVWMISFKKAPYSLNCLVINFVFLLICKRSYARILWTKLKSTKIIWTTIIWLYCSQTFTFTVIFWIVTKKGNQFLMIHKRKLCRSFGRSTCGFFWIYENRVATTGIAVYEKCQYIAIHTIIFWLLCCRAIFVAACTRTLTPYTPFILIAAKLSLLFCFCFLFCVRAFFRYDPTWLFCVN